MKDKYVHAAISMNWKSYSMDGDLSNHLLTSDHVSPIPLIGTWQLTMFPFLWPSCKLYCRFALKLCVCLPQLAIFLQEKKKELPNVGKGNLDIWSKMKTKTQLSTFWWTEILCRSTWNGYWSGGYQDGFRWLGKWQRNVRKYLEHLPASQALGWQRQIQMVE